MSALPTSGVSPLLVTFTPAASDPDGYINSYYWNFGDNTSSTAVFPTHTYTAAGSYLATLTVTDSGGATASTSVTINVSSPAPAASSQLRVLSWNVNFGGGTDGVTNWDRTASYIANFNADIVGLCEVPPDSISTLVTLLQQKTGRTWYWYFVPKYDGCPEGNLILSKYSFVSSSGRYLSYERSVAQVTINVGGRNVNFFATHLDAYTASYRYQEVTELQSFASGFAEPRIVVGDFNAGPDLTESIHMCDLYYDGWMKALNIGSAIAYPDNPVYDQTRTRRGRLDYVYLSKTANAYIQGTQIPDVRDLNNPNVVYTLGTLDDKGVRPSDHNPMIATIQLQ
jgi:endonuclease/exonuclease/phosphatase family metal-dependent hydrolase